MATRKSGRIVRSSAEGPSGSKDEEYHSSSEVEERSEDEAPKRKKARTSNKGKASTSNAQLVSAVQPPAPKRPRGNRGLLRNVVDMPLDIVFEIFGNLSPGDLLNLAHTTKDLRRILMSRSSASVWKQARENDPTLPDCPADLSEPQYADLCYGKGCSNCARSRITVTYTVWSARVRLCKSCAEDKCAASYTNIYRLNTTFIGLIPSVSIRRPGRWRRVEKSYYTPAVDSLVKALASANQETKVALENELKVKQEHGDACNKWFLKRTSEIRDQKASTAEERRDLIIEHARKMGWDDEFELSGHALDAIKQSDVLRKACGKNVTAKVLANLEDTIDEVLQIAQTKRISQARIALLKKRIGVYKTVFDQCVKTLSPARPLPKARLIYEIPRVRDLIVNTLPDVEMTAEHFQSVVEEFPALVAEWRTQISAKLLDLVKSAVGQPFKVDDDRVLDLATTIFVCSRCGLNYHEYMNYPRALSHICTVGPYSPFVNRGNSPSSQIPDDSSEDLALKSVLMQGRWNINNFLTVPTDIVKLMGDIVELCGFDRHTTTREEMDKKNPMIECLSCHKDSEGRAVMPWWAVVQHWSQVHAVKYRGGYNGDARETMNLRVLTDPQEVERAQAELNLQREKDTYRHKTLTCVKCHLRETTAVLKRHCKSEHQSYAEGDIVPAIDASHYHGIHYVWPPRDDEAHRLLEPQGTKVTVTKGWADNASAA